MTTFPKLIMVVVAILILCVTLLPLKAVPQAGSHQLSKLDVVKLLKGQVSPHRVGQRAREQGIDFEVTPDVERELRQSGANNELIGTLRELAPKSGQIVVETSPQAEVYLDDEYAGRASAQGRLVIGNAKPGEHNMRVSLTGKKDFEQKLTVVATQSANVQAALLDSLASIQVQTSAGAEIFLDGSSRGSANPAGQLVVSDVTPGAHELRVVVQNKKDFRQSTTVLAGQQSTVDAMLADIEKPPAEAPKPVTRAGTTRVNPKDGLKYVWIPPGTFTMGCSPGDNLCGNDEKPTHQVTIMRGFWIGQTPVTVVAYKRFTRATGSKIPPAPKFNKGWMNENMPVVNVTWDNSQVYCAWTGGRLPTEAEWECAARAGSTDVRNEPLDEVAWYLNNSGGQTHDVAQKRANPFGLHDMLGNVREWVGDRYLYYQSGPVQDPQGATKGYTRVVRGGSWLSSPRFVRASYRDKLGQDNRYDDLGFRCADEVVNP
jgi:formylglycine-generating enzyme required for sulfatase activity